MYLHDDWNVTGVRLIWIAVALWILKSLWFGFLVFHEIFWLVVLIICYFHLNSGKMNPFLTSILQIGLKLPTSFVLKLLGMGCKWWNPANLVKGRKPSIGLYPSASVLGCLNLSNQFQVIFLVDSHQCDAFFEMFFLQTMMYIGKWNYFSCWDEQWTIMF